MRAWLVLLLLLLSVRARADEMRATIAGNGWWDAALVATGTTGIVVGTWVLRPTDGDRAPLDGLGHRPSSTALARVSDFGLVLGLSGGAAASALADRGVTGFDRFRGPVITLEGALVASMFAQLTKNAFGVCRPRDWSDGRCAADREAHRSFPSGHTAPLAGMAGAALGLALLPSSPKREDLVVAVGCTSVALGVAVLRERAGAHSLVDVGVSLLVGGLAGFSVAALHLTPSTTTTSGSAPLVSFGGAF